MMRILNARTKVIVAEVDDNGNMRYLDLNGNEKKYPEEVLIETEENQDAPGTTS
jgi:hypothetical protein